MFVVGFANLITAQNSDTLQQYIITQAAQTFEMAFQDPNTAKQLSEQLLQDSERISDDLAAANAHNSLGWSYFHLGELDSAIVTLNRSKTLFAANGKPKEVIQVLINLSEVHVRKSGYQSALTCVLQADSINQMLGDPFLQTDLYRQFAILYRELGSYDKATSYFLLAMNGFFEQEDVFRYVNTGISLSILYRKKDQWTNSLDLLHELESSEHRYALSDYQRAMVNENLGETYFGMKDFANALVHFDRAYRLFEALALGGDMAYEAMNVGKSHRQLGQWDEAEFYLLQANQFTDSLALINYSYDVAMELSSLYAEKKEWQLAYSFAEEARVLFDSLNLQEQVRFSRELSEKFENDKNENEIALLNARNALNESKKKKAVVGVYLLIAVSIASLWIAFLMRSRIKLSKKLEHERKQNRIAGDIEDERKLNQFVFSLFGKHTVSDILATLAQNCVSCFGFEGGWIYVANSTPEHLELRAQADQQGLVLDEHNSFPVARSIADLVYNSGKSIRIDDSTELQIAKNVDKLNSEGPPMLAAPVLLDGSVFAIVCIEGTVGVPFTDRQTRLLERAAAVCSQRITKLITEEELRLHIARDLHDELGSTLTSISILSKLATNDADPKQSTYLQKIHTYSVKMMESMSDIIWAINPSRDTMHEALLRMKTYAVDLIESADMICEFSQQGISEQDILSAEERKYIYLIFREAVHNAVKYSKARRITISIKQSDTYFSFSVEDDGVGFDLEKAAFGNGINNMYERANAIHAAVDIITATGSGTRVELLKQTQVYR